MTAVDDRTLGRMRYSSDMEVPGMLHAVLVRSPHASAAVRSIDVSRVPDDVVTLQASDLGDLARKRYGAAILDQPILAVDRVRHVGEPVVAVAAATPRAAREAADLVSVQYDLTEAAVGAVAAAQPGAPLVHADLDMGPGLAAAMNVQLRPTPASNVCHTFRLHTGESDWKVDADVIVEREYHVAGAAHMPLEAHATIAFWERDHLTVATGTQTPFANRAALASLFEVPEEHVRIQALPMGGSFGAKTFLRAEPITVALARKAGKPVRMSFSRVEEFLTLNRHPATFRITLGATRAGVLVGKSIDVWWDTGAYADAGPDVATKGGYASIGPYRIPNVQLTSRCVYTNTVPNGAYRGYAATQASWASERCMDELARELGVDPLQFRLDNLLHSGDTFHTGEVLEDFHVEECLRACAEAIEWETGTRGKGLAVVMKGMHTPSRACAAIEVTDGALVIRTGTTEFGQRVDLIQARLAAASLRAPVTVFSQAPNDTDEVPFDARTTSSRSAHMMSHALDMAARDLRAKVADKLGVEPESLDFMQGDVRADGDRYEWEEFSGLRGDGEHLTEGGLDPDTGQGLASSDWHQGAAGVELDVDEETGMLTLTRVHTAAWAGKVVDRTGAELQTEGCMILGVGTTLFEQVSTDADGQPQQATMSDYNIPSMVDIPPLTYDLLEEEPTDGLLAPVHGLGETALPPVPAAIGNAVQSLGAFVRELPLTAESVLVAFDESRDTGAGPDHGEAPS